MADPMIRWRLALIAAVIVCASPAVAVDVWVTSGDRSRLLAQQPDVVFQPGSGGGGVAVTVNTAQRFQSIDGFGAAMTDSSASLLESGLAGAARNRAFDDLFSTDDGIGLSYLRLAMGSSDFTSQGFYTYNDLGPGQTDPGQTSFSIAPDHVNVLPALERARNRGGDFSLMGSPWSAPGWMKTGNSVIGGSLRNEFYGSYATYLRKFVDAYAAEGFTIDSLTLQNEPEFAPLSYPGMLMTAAEQIDLVANHVGPEFAGAGLDTELIAFDHNWDNPGYPIQVLNDPVARQFLAGSAFHGYAGNVSAQSTVRDAHPDKGIYFTELSGGDFAPDFGDNLLFYARNLLVGGTRNWAKTVMLWNLALDEDGDPHLGGCSDCRGVVTVDSTTGDVTANEEFYALGHASRFVRPGAVRVGTPTFNNLLETVAFENPDGSIALIATNPTGATQGLRAVEGGRHFRFDVPPRSVATFLWDGDGGADFDNGGFELGGFDTTGGSLDGWLPWGVSGDNVAVTNAEALEGEHSLRLTGAGGAGSFSGVSQGVTVEEGDTLRVDASVLLPNAGSIAGTDNSLLMKIEYYDTYGGVFQSPQFLEQTELTVANGASAVGQWDPKQIVDVAPDGAVEARLVFVFSQPTGQGGAVLVDGVTLSVIEPLAGDFNGDGVVDAADFTVWRDGFAVGDFTVDDYQEWVDNFGATRDPAAQSLPEPGAAAAVAIALLTGVVSRSRSFER